MNGRHHSIVGPVILIGFGILLLLSNLGMLQWSVWEAALRLWPLLLVAIGLDLLIGRRSAFGSLLVAIILVALMAAGIWWITGQATGGSELPGSNVSQPLAEARSAAVELKAAAGQLLVAGGAAAGSLVEGSVFADPGAPPVSSSSLDNGVQRFSLTASGPSGVGIPWSSQRAWNLRLTGQVPLSLRATLGAGEMSLDLRGVRATDVLVEVGAGRGTVTLPRDTAVKARLNLAVGEIVVRVPRGSALNLTLRTAIGASRLPSGEQRLGTSNYTTAGYATAGDRLDVDVSCAVGSVVVEEY